MTVLTRMYGRFDDGGYHEWVEVNVPIDGFGTCPQELETVPCYSDECYEIGAWDVHPTSVGAYAECVCGYTVTLRYVDPD
jgi:hypothetical protein